MSAFSDEMAAVGLELLTEFGEAVTFTRTTEGSYNPTTAKTGTGTDITFSGYGSPVDYDNREIDGDLVQRGDIKLYVNATSTAPEVSDRVTLDSVVYRVMDVRRYAVNSENVLYELQIRI